LAEGVNAVREAVTGHAAGEVVVHELVVGAAALIKHADIVALAEDAGILVTPASDFVLEALSETVTPQGIVAVVDTFDASLQDLLDRRPSLLAMLGDVRDPGNAGSAIRVADAAGADGVVFAGDSVDPYNGKVVRSSVGGLFHLPIVGAAGAKSVRDCIAAIRERGLRVLVADPSGPIALDDPDVDDLLGAPTAWVFGNEAWGVRHDVVDAADAVVRIPIYGRAESLNVATAVALCLYASARAQRLQRGAGGLS
jgi:TrmH family RNA methyltransferase